MSSHQNSPNKCAFTSHCLPGSVAEQEEKERLAAFQRHKALRKAEEAQMEAEQRAQRDEKYLADFEAHQKRKHGKTTTYPLRSR